MQTFYSICVLLLSLTVAGRTSAQTPGVTPPVLPPGPLVAKNAPDFAAWTVSTSAIASAAESQGQDGQTGADGANPGKTTRVHQVIQVVKTRDIRFIRIEAGNMMSERWCKAGIQIIKRPEWKEPLLSSGENRADGARLDFGGGDFGGF